MAQKVRTFKSQRPLVVEMRTYGAWVPNVKLFDQYEACVYGNDPEASFLQERLGEQKKNCNKSM